MSSSRLNTTHKALIRRYLIWAYKSTKESFDRLERKTTQLLADEFILRSIAKKKSTRVPAGYTALLDEYKQYIHTKKAAVIDEAKHLYLANRLKAVEEAIVFYLGKKELTAISTAYEDEFIRRIWESKEH